MLGIRLRIKTGVEDTESETISLPEQLSRKTRASKFEKK